MGKTKVHDPIKIIVGLITNNKNIFSATTSILSKKFGPIDIESEILPFNHTDYYEQEMGQSLVRKFLSFRKLVKPDGVEKIKLLTNNIERRFCRSGKRSINIDPGYLTQNKLVLLTTKNYSHRLYIKNGIFAEVTLYFKNSEFQSWPWSYPDYKTDDYKNFFKRVRNTYLGQKK